MNFLDYRSNLHHKNFEMGSPSMNWKIHFFWGPYYNKNHLVTIVRYLDEAFFICGQESINYSVSKKMSLCLAQLFSPI